MDLNMALKISTIATHLTVMDKQKSLLVASRDLVPFKNKNKERIL
jgi:hypothetical protein